MGGEFGPTEDTVSAFLELLVDPLLPSLSSLARNEAPSSAQEESVAKQVQAVVLLYDYYHRKCNPELEFLDHVSFCKLAVVLKPSLLPYMESVKKDKDSELGENEMKLSLTDKMIMEACDISKTLETSNAADVAEWPIPNVAVFLVDSSKEYCNLLHSSITQGVWSVIEKDCSSEDKTPSKKKRITKKPLKESRNDETVFRQLAFAAVKDACGCSQNELEILESHTVYSLSKAKTAVRFYIMQSKRTKEEDYYVPIRDVLDSLQGPLVTKDACIWATTSVVEYFHLLPYAEILSDWFSGEPTLEASHEAGSEQENSEQPPSDSNIEDNKRERSQKVVSLPNEVSDPCKMPHKEDSEAGYSNSSTVTRANSSEKVDTEQEISVTPVNTSVQNDRGLEIENQSKEAPSRILRSYSSTVAKTNTSDKIETDQEISVTPVNTKVQDDVRLVVENQSKGSPSRILRSGMKSEKMKAADKKVERVETAVYSKRKKTLKDTVGDNSGCKLSKADAIPECSIQRDNEISVSDMSNNMEIDEPVSSVDCSIDGKNKSCCSEDHVPNELKAIVLSQNCPPSPTTDIVTKEEIVSALQTTHTQNGENRNAQVKAATSCHNGMQEANVATFQSTHEQNGENNNARVKAISSCQDGVQVNALIPYGSNFGDLEKTHKVVSLRETLLSQTALKVLYRKRDMLSYQRRSIEDEIALCNSNIEAILNGSEDNLGVKLDSIIEACNFETLSGGVSDHERMYQHSQDQNTRNYLKRKRLSEANLVLQNPCKELDDICHENCWVIPTYNITLSDGGYRAAVMVKGVEFECSSTGGTCNTPVEARESAASLALTKLREMASVS